MKTLRFLRLHTRSQVKHSI